MAIGAISNAVAVLEMNMPISAASTKTPASSASGPNGPSPATSPSAISATPPVCSSALASGSTVSYTHLDVYKRQAQSYLRQTGTLVESPPLFIAHLVQQANGNPQALADLLADSAKERVVDKPVSYTHLDVYKRQGPDGR